MFRIISRLYFGLCSVFIFSIPLFAADSALSVPNPSFEEVTASGIPDQWTAYSKKYSVDENVSLTGKRSLRWRNDDENHYSLSKVWIRSLTAGMGAEVSLSFKTENVKGRGAAFCVEYWDENDKFIEGDYFTGGTGTADWKRVSIICDVPDRTAYSTLCCFGASGTTGTIWFDDIQIRKARLSRVEALTTDRYRHQTDGGFVTVYAGLRDDISPERKEKSRLEIFDEAGKAISSLNAADTAPKTLLFKFDSTPLAPGKYRLKLSVPRLDEDEPDVECLTLTKFETLPKYHSRIDAHQRLILEGKPFFPIGLYSHDLKDEDIARLADSPFNCVISYHRLSRETMDKMLARGIRTIYSAGFWKEDPEAALKSAAERVQSLKDHPGIIAWYVFDEAPAAFKPDLIRHRDMVEANDPQRPTIAVTDKTKDIRPLMASYDVIGTDPYPITRPWDLTLKPAQAYEWTKSTRDSVWGTRALWQVPQLFNWGIYNKLDIPPETFRRPTFDEMRAMIWMCVAGGANGLIGYSYYDIVHRFPKEPPVTDEEKKMAQEKHWNEVVKIMREVEKRVPILLSIEEPMPIIPDRGSPEEIVFRLYGHEGSAWLLLVNTSEEEMTGTFMNPDGKNLMIMNPEELKEAKTNLDGNRLRVTLPPLTPIFIQLKNANN